MYERLLQSTGRTFYTMITQGVGAIINIILDPVFIFVFKMGVQGAAIATVIGQIVAFILAVYFNRHKNPDLHLDFKKFKPSGRFIGEIYKIGVPSILMVAIGSVMTYFMNKILIAYTLGKELSVNVFGAFFKLNSFICMPIFGLNNGVIPIIAYNYGAMKKHRMIKTIKLSVVYAEVFSIIGAILFFTLPKVLLGFFSATPEMLRIGIPALKIISVSFLFAGANIALSGVFQSFGKSVFSMISSFIRQLVVLIPVAYVLARYGLSIGNDNLVWWSYSIADFAASVVSIVCFIILYKKIIKPIRNDQTE